MELLVVDDEPALLGLMQRFLQQSGHSVDICGDSATGLEKVTSSPDKYGLVVADLSLSGMTGDQMGLRMIEASPALKILLCSGYPFEIASLPDNKQKQFGSLLKPFTPKMLTAAVEELLAR